MDAERRDSDRSPHGAGASPPEGEPENNEMALDGR